jgi:hypothetical protein
MNSTCVWQAEMTVIAKTAMRIAIATIAMRIAIATIAMRIATATVTATNVKTRVMCTKMMGVQITVTKKKIVK